MAEDIQDLELKAPIITGPEGYWGEITWEEEVGEGKNRERGFYIKFDAPFEQRYKQEITEDQKRLGRVYFKNGYEWFRELGTRQRVVFSYFTWDKKTNVLDDKDIELKDIIQSLRSRIRGLEFMHKAQQIAYYQLSSSAGINSMTEKILTQVERGMINFAMKLEKDKK